MKDDPLLSKTTMDTHRKLDTEKSRVWHIPEVHKTRENIEYLVQRPPAPLRSTIVFKLHKPGRWKTATLVNAFVWGHNLIAQIYGAYSDDASNTASNIFALIAATEATARERIARKQGEHAIEHDDSQEDMVDQESRTKVRYLANDVALTLRIPCPYTEDEIHHQRLYEGYTRRAASAILSWRQKVIRAVAGVLDKPRRDIILDDIQQVYQTIVSTYEIAAATPIPFGRNRGERLDRFGKREARWLLDHLLPEDEIRELIQAIDALLDEDRRAVGSRAAVVVYRGKHVQKPDRQRHTRAVRESYLLQRLHERPGDPVLLGTLHRNELETLRQELKENATYHAEIREQLEDARGQLQVTCAAMSELRGLADALETYLYKKPPSFPAAEQVDLSAERRAQNQDIYKRWFSWFLIAPDKPCDAKRFLNVDQEHKEVQGLLKASKKLRWPRLQPLPFIGTMRPGQWRDFALLYERDTYTLVLAVILHRRGADIYDDMYRTGQEHPSRQAQHAEYQRRRDERPLYFVNAPETPFRPPDNVPVILFPLEYGSKRYHKQVRDMIAQQREAQQRFFEEQRVTKPSISIADCFPLDVPLKSARLICTWADNGTPEFYIHIAVKQHLLPITTLPSSILAISEDPNDGYYWTLLDLAAKQRYHAGQPICGKLAIPSHVDPAKGARVNSPNYIYETAKAVAALAERHQAVIAIQDTRWKKRRGAINRDQNRRFFRRPSGRVMDAIVFKARQRGLMKPYIVGNVSPVRDCAHCQRGLSRKAEVTTTWYEWRIACPQCGTEVTLSNDKIVHECITCQHQWEPQAGEEWYEQRFSCPRCQSPSTSALNNTALVTGQKGLLAIAKHAANARRIDAQLAERLVKHAAPATPMIL
jgi:hypothetical protein